MLSDRRRVGAASWQARRASLLSLTIHVALVALVSGLVTAASREETAVRFLERSETAFVGNLIEARSAPSSDGRLILTRYVFAVLETIPLPGAHAGPAASRSTIEIVEYGGTVGETTLTLSHGVGYRHGSAYLVFVGRDENGWLRTVGGPLGRLAVTTDGPGRKVVRLYPGHPLSSLMKGPPRLFRGLREIRERLRTLSGGASR